MTETPAAKAALNRREQRKLAREKTATAAAVQAQAVTPAEIKEAQPVQPKPKPAPQPRAVERQRNAAQAAEDVARVPDPTEVSFETFRSRKPTLHELNQIAKANARVRAEEARVVGQAAARAAHGALLGHRNGNKPDVYAAKAAAQAAMDAAKAATAAKTE